MLKLIAEYSDKALPVIFGAAAGSADNSETVDKGREVSPVGILMHQASGAKSESMSRLEKAVMTVVPSSSSSSSSGPTGKISNKAVDKSGLAPALIAPEPKQESKTAAKPQSLAPSLPSLTQSSSEKGIARYNELLADYFIRHSGSAAEPPSYEEWVKSGTKDF